MSELFFAADAEERRLILINLPYAPLPPAAAIAPAVAKEASNRLEAAALGHNTELFARELERVLGISRAQARRIYEDQSGEPIVVAAVALDMPSFVLQRVLLCLHPAISQSVQRVYELALLHEEIETESALRMVAIWRAGHPADNKRPARPDAGHQPQYAPDGKRARPPHRRAAGVAAEDPLGRARAGEGRERVAQALTPPRCRGNCGRRGPRPRRSRHRGRT